jgi:hypothetical protein
VADVDHGISTSPSVSLSASEEGGDILEGLRPSKSPRLTMYGESIKKALSKERAF